MEDINIPSPNPFISEWLVGPECLDLVRDRTELARTLYQSIVAKQSGDLAGSARVAVGISGSNARYRGTLTVGGIDAPYGASHEFGTQYQNSAEDLTVVLGMLGQL